MNTSALAQIEYTCRSLADDDRFRIDGVAYDGLPNRRLDIDELAAHLSHRDTPSVVRDALWRDLIDRTRGPDETWVLVAIRLAMPGIRRAIARARPILTTFPRAELETEAVCIFTTALRTIDITPSRPCSRLCQRVSSGLRTFLRDQLREIRIATETVFESQPPIRPYGHVDIVIANAVRERIITMQEAALIIEIRLEGNDIVDVAEQSGMPRLEFMLSYKGAEHRIVEWLQGNCE